MTFVYVLGTMSRRRRSWNDVPETTAGGTLGTTTVEPAGRDRRGGTRNAPGHPTGPGAADNPYQRGPDPTVTSVAATRGTFATAQLTAPAGNGFGGGYLYYPTDTSAGKWGAVAIVPGYSALFANDHHLAG
jgi:hypothetical protein